MSLPTDVAACIDRVEPASRQADARVLVELLRDATGLDPYLWGTIIGFGTYHYRYRSGHEGDAPLIGFAPRKAKTSIYLMAGFADRHPELVARLGPHKAAVGCLYVGKLDAIDLGVLRELVDLTIAEHRAMDVRSRTGPS